MRAKVFHIILFLIDITPQVSSDCFELYYNGFITEGVYEVDITGNKDPTNTVSVYCKMGWTYLLTRGQYGNSEVII